MFHSNTQRLIDHWRGLKPAQGAPVRATFDPAEVASLLPQTFMLARSTALPFRLAGGGIEQLHGRSLRGQSFLTLWSVTSRAAVRDAAVAAIRHVEPVALYAEARSEDGGNVGLELVIAPLAGPQGVIDRLLGHYQTISAPMRDDAEPLLELTHKLSLYGAGDATQPARMTLAAVDGRRIA